MTLRPFAAKRRLGILCLLALNTALLSDRSPAQTPTHGTGVTGIWDITDHKLDDGGTYHIYVKLHAGQPGQAGALSYPWGDRPIGSARWNGEHFQLFAPENKLLAEGDLVGKDLALHLAVGEQKGLPRKAIAVAIEPVPPKLPHSAIKPVPSNSLAMTPPMGWNSWNRFKEAIDDKTVRAMADAMVSNGMRDAGYLYVNIDDTWEGPRDAQGNITTNAKFPNMRALADYVHSRGLKLGLYSSPGHLTCAGYSGSYGHEVQDARTFAGWGIDYLKYDWCSAAKIYGRDDLQAVYQKMGAAIADAGRPIVFSLCEYGWGDVWKWGPQVGGNLWRTTNDINDNWNSMSTIGFSQDSIAAYAGPGHWNDPDMLEVGNGHMTAEEYRTHFSLWSLLAAPLLAGNDIAHMSDDTRSILLNREVIAIDQDPKGKQATLLARTGQQEVWSKPLADGSYAVGLFNRSAVPATVTLDLSALGITDATARDLWRHSDLSIRGTKYPSVVASHGVTLLRVIPAGSRTATLRKSLQN